MNQQKEFIVYEDETFRITYIPEDMGRIGRFYISEGAVYDLPNTPRHTSWNQIAHLTYAQMQILYSRDMFAHALDEALKVNRMALGSAH